MSSLKIEVSKSSAFPIIASWSHECKIPRERRPNEDKILKFWQVELQLKNEKTKKFTEKIKTQFSSVNIIETNQLKKSKKTQDFFKSIVI